MGEFDCAMCKGPLGIPIIRVHPFGDLCWDCYQKFDEVVIWKSASRSRNHQLEKKIREFFVPSEKIVSKNFDDYLKACPTRPFANHHKGEVVEISDNKFVFDLDLTCFAESSDNVPIQKLLKSGNKSVSLKIKSDGKSLRYEITDSTGVCYSIKHLGKNGDVEVECKTSKGATQEENGGVDMGNLQRLAGVSQLLLVEITKKNAQVTSKVLESMECPICNEVMKPPIFLCSNGHSYCGVCKPQLLNCPYCRGELANTRNYALEALVEELDRDKVNGEDEENTKGVCAIITSSRSWLLVSSWLGKMCRTST